MSPSVSPKKVAFFLLCIFLSPFATCLALKANIGTGAYSALSKTLSPLLNIKIGTLQAIFNSICILVEWIILKKDFKLRHFLQFFMAIAMGSLTNYFYYIFFANFSLENYVLRVVLLIVGDIINSFAVATLLNLKLVSTPLGGMCHVVSNALKKPYAFSRQSVDVLCLIIIAIAVLFFHGELTVREGTILSALEFGPMVDFWLAKTKPLAEE